MSIGKVVTGQEVLTTEGEIIGLFLTRPVKSGLTAKQAALEIKGDGGLVYLEHPYDRARRSLSEVGIEEVADLIDIVEVFNGRSDEKANHLAEDLRATLGAAPGAGSDAHLLEEIGSVYIEMEPFDGAGDFLAKLRRSRIVKHRNQFLLTAEALLRHTMGRQ
jgi:predicted metal-dependent phosphoesterase TrpH